MRRAVRLLALFAAIASGGVIVATVGWAQRWNVVTITLLFVLVWAATITVIDAVVIGRMPPGAAPAVSERRSPGMARGIPRVGFEDAMRRLMFRCSERERPPAAARRRFRSVRSWARPYHRLG